MNLEPTPHEQYFLELVNRARLNPEEEATLFDINLNEGLDQNTTTSEARQPEEPNQDTISPEAKQPLAFNPQLLEAALNHSQWMLDTNTFSHTGLDGSSPSERAENVGYPSSFVGENIAWRGTTDNVDNLTNFVEQLHQGLFVSPSHRLNLMKPEYQEIGVGVVTGEFTNDGNDFNTVMVSQEFGTDFNNDNFFITGIVYDDIDESNFYEPGEGLSEITVEATSTTDDFTATTTTRTAGGYQIEVPSGEYEVTFTGSELETPVTEVVTVDESNVKVDTVTSDINNSQGEVTLEQDQLNFQTPLSQ
ncbi:MAG: CAP domain-containing protein, partial [Halothece sp.]